MFKKKTLNLCQIWSLSFGFFSMIAMFLMPNAPLIVQVGGYATLIFGAAMPAAMNGAFDIAFQPYRALVADMAPDMYIGKEQKSKLFINTSLSHHEK